MNFNTIKNLNVAIANWNLDHKELSRIRRLVFIEEQNVPEALEWDGFDEASSHYKATLNNKMIACARLKPDGQIGRMAVLPEYRNKGIGNRLLRLILQGAQEKNIKQLFLHAQVEAIPFYEKQGFIAHGNVFFEANIPHREMLKKLC